jgi:hypothetical protein
MQVRWSLTQKSTSRYPSAGADIAVVKLRASTLDRIAKAYAEAVAAGDLDAAEGWFATARYVADREADRQGARAAARPIARSRRPSLR